MTKHHNFAAPALILITLFIISSFHVAAQPISAVPAGEDLASEYIPVDPAVRIGELSNGMRYYLRYNNRPENRAELRLAVAAGSIDEDEDQLGLAHFVEHMAFNGSENFTKNELVDYLESVGMRFGPDLNAYTSFEETVYMLQIRTDDAEQFDKGITVLRDWAGGLLFDEEEIDKERGVVIAEWRTRLSAEQRMQQVYFPLLYDNSRYAQRLPIGDPEIIEHADYETIRRFYDDWYRPELMAVCIVGDIDLDASEAVIVERFSTLENPAESRPKVHYSVPGHTETIVSVNSDREATGSTIRIYYKHSKQPTESLKDYRRILIQQLYNRMLNARLQELNTTADPPFIFASSGYGRNVGDIDMYSSFARVPEGGIERGFEVLLAENKRALEHGFLTSELERQKTAMLALAERNVREKDRTESSRFVSAYVSHFLQNTPIPDAEQVLDLYNRFLPGISVEEINALSRQWVTDENRVIIVTAPEKEGVRLPSEDELLAMVAKVDAMQTDPYEDDMVEAPLVTAELQVWPVREEVVQSALGIHALALDNGIRVVYRQTDFKNDEILFSAFSWGGNSLYSDDAYPSTMAVSSVLQESGVGAFNAPQLRKQLTGKIVNVSPFIAERFEGFNGSCSPAGLETLFQLVYLYATSPRWEDDAFQAYTKKQHDMIQNLMSNPNNYFADVLQRVRYQDHPRRGLPTLDDLAKVDPQLVQNIYQDRFRDFSDFTFFLTGAIDPEELKRFVSKYLGNLPSIAREESWQDIGVRTVQGRIDTTFYRGEAPRSTVRIIYHGDFEWNDKNRFAFQMLIDHTRIKLRETMREDMGGVYGVSIFGSTSNEPVPEYSITISFNSDPPRTDELLSAAYKVIEEIRKGNITADDIQKITETQRQSRIRDLRENRFWHNALINNWMEGIPLENLTLEYLEGNLETVTPELIRKAAIRYFNSSNRIQAVMHPEE